MNLKYVLNFNVKLYCFTFSSSRSVLRLDVDLSTSRSISWLSPSIELRMGVRCLPDPTGENGGGKGEKGGGVAVCEPCSVDVSGVNMRPKAAVRSRLEPSLPTRCSLQKHIEICIF